MILAHTTNHTDCGITFAVRLLEKGVPLETVSILLAHKSILITQKHYAPWVRSRQIALEAAIQAALK